MTELEPARSLRLADHDARGVARTGNGQDLLDDRPPGHAHDLGAQLLGEPQRLGKPRLLELRQKRMSFGLDVERDQLRIEALGGALGGPHGVGRVGTGIDAHDHPLAGPPGAGDGMLAHVAQHLLVDPLGGSAQGELAQGCQVAG